MFKTLESSDKSRRVFETFKNFTFNQNDSGSGVFAIKARSGSFRNYVSSSDDIITITSGSVSKNYYSLPNWNFINTRYYKFFELNTPKEAYFPFGIERYSHESRSLHTSASIISITRDLYGEKIKPGSIQLDVTIGGQLFEIRDDSEGTLYDYAHSASFAAFKSSSFNRSQGVLSNGSGSDVGNVFYEQGLITLTDTGSYTSDASSWTLKYKSTQTHYEYEYRVKVQPNEFNTSTNISLTPGRSGSQTITEGVVSMSNNSFSYSLTTK